MNKVSRKKIMCHMDALVSQASQLTAMSGVYPPHPNSDLYSQCFLTSSYVYTLIKLEQTLAYAFPVCVFFCCISTLNKNSACLVCELAPNTNVS